MSQKFKLTITSRLENLKRVSQFVEKAGHALGLDADRLYDVQMAVDEAITNVIEHAYAEQPNGKINLTIEKRGADFWIAIQDSGRPFNPDEILPPQTSAPLSERNIGGLGIFFMRRLMDTVDFSFDRKRGNLLVMTKRIE